MANFTFHNPSSSAYFTLEEVRNSIGFYDSSSYKYGSGSFSSFTGSNPDHVVQSNYIWLKLSPQEHQVLILFLILIFRLVGFILEEPGNLT